MKLRRKKNKTKQATKLAGQVRQEIYQAPRPGFTPNTDSIDQDLQSYVNSFLADFSKIPKLEKFDLLTPESAAHAVQILDKTKADLDAKLKTARLLKGLLEQNKVG